MKKLSKTEKAWLAGFIDGEGYIGLTFQRKKVTKHSAASLRYHPFLIIANTNKEVLYFIRELIGEGRIYVMHKSTNNKKTSYQYKLTKMDVLYEILVLLLPYLRVKGVQCQLLINYIKRRRSINPKTGRGRRGVTSFTDIDEEIYQQLLLLNKRGN